MLRKNFNRSARVAEVLHRKLAEIMLRHRENPSFVGVTITEVKLAPDLSSAKIFVTFFNETKIEKSVKHLNMEVGFLRHALAGELNLRIVPNLFFVYDSSVRYGEHLSSLIDTAVLSDETKHKNIDQIDHE